MNNSTCARDMELIRSQMDGVSEAARLPISFVLGEERIKGIPASFSPVCEVVQTRSTVTDHVYVGRDPSGTLEIKTVVTEYADYPVYDVVTWFTAVGSVNTPMLRCIRAFDKVFQGEEAVLYTNSGDFCSPHSYEQTEQQYTHELWTHITPQGGRPCDQAFPYFKVQFAGHGLNLAVGWPGQWAADFGIITGGIQFSAGQEVTAFYLKPGETMRTPKITVMAYDGDYERGVNLWRRWYCAHVLPRPNGKPIPAYLCASYSGGGREFQSSTESNQIEYIEKYAASGIPYNVWWVDAGWYFCDTDSPLAEDGRLWYMTGSWYADPKRYPKGFRPVTEKLHEHNMDLLLWFEPERVRPGSAIHRDHPEWLFNADNEDDGQCGVARNFILNLAIPECTDWLIETYDALIKDYGITVYRQDFNFPPLRYWRENEAFDRQGAVENLYIQGYLRFWDALLERNPGLWIDSCASGGRRNDLESLRRSVPLHPTDYGYGYQHIGQAFFRTLQEWFPYSRTVSTDWSLEDNTYPTPEKAVSRPADYFTWIASISPFFAPYFPLEPGEQEKTVARIWRRAADILVQCDFYPLSKTSKKTDNFCVNQYYRPQEGKGYVQAVRHVDCPQEVFHAHLRDIDDDKTYVFEDMMTEQRMELTGRQLNEKGLDIFLEKRGAAIWFYEIKA